MINPHRFLNILDAEDAQRRQLGMPTVTCQILGHFGCRWRQIERQQGSGTLIMSHFHALGWQTAPSHG